MEQIIEKIETWNHEDFWGLICYLKSIWVNKNDVIVEWKIGKYAHRICEFSVHNTDNLPEQMEYMNALMRNAEFRTAYYYKWIRGGNHYFLIDATNLGWVTVSELAKRMGISRQNFWQNHSDTEMIRLGTRKILVNLKNFELLEEDEQ